MKKQQRKGDFKFSGLAYPETDSNGNVRFRIFSKKSEREIAVQRLLMILALITSVTGLVLLMR